MYSRHSIAHSLCTQINHIQSTNQVENILTSSSLNNYADIKKLNKQLHTFFIENTIEIKRTVLLNYLSKALGFQNHHSLKNYLDSKILLPVIDLRGDSHITSNTTGSKFLKLCKVLQSLLNEFKYSFNEKHDIHMKRFGSDFYLAISVDNRETKYSSTIKVVESILKDFSMKIKDNTIQILKINQKDSLAIAHKIASHYKAFFKASHYQEGKHNKLSYSYNNWSILSYSKISANSSSSLTNQILYVDNYSSDAPEDTISNFLMYVLEKGDMDDINFLEAIIDNPNKKHDFKKIDIFKQFTIAEHAEEKLLRHIVRQTILQEEDTLLDVHLSHSINVETEIQKCLLDIEKLLEKPIKVIVNDLTIYAREHELSSYDEITPYVISIISPAQTLHEKNVFSHTAKILTTFCIKTKNMVLKGEEMLYAIQQANNSKKDYIEL